jgi:penicillin V acylase-like amidase (Ntn superfamily)
MKKVLFLSLCCFASPLLFACTTFCINKNGQIVFGRNYDWITGAGIVNTNQRGLVKSSMSNGPGGIVAWISKYGSITFNQYGKEFPTGGMNEKGLVVELMWLDETVYPPADARPAIGVLQWIQYQLDNAASVEEVIASDAQVRITEKGTPIHYLVADASGATASIEFLNGKMVVHKGETLPFPVLTNDTYAASAATAQPLLGQNTNLRNNSLDRFVKACNMIKQFNETGSSLPLTDFAFSILGRVSQGSYTQWSIVYDISAKKIYFKTEAYAEIKTIDFAAFDFACSSPAKMFNMNQPGSGDISLRFTLPDKKLKQQVMRQVAEESSSRVSISKKEEEALLNFENGVSCKQ